MGTSKPVSYTHLDVYKRQVPEPIDRLFGKEEPNELLLLDKVGFLMDIGFTEDTAVEGRLCNCDCD